MIDNAPPSCRSTARFWRRELNRTVNRGLRPDEVARQKRHAVEAKQERLREAP